MAPPVAPAKLALEVSPIFRGEVIEHLTANVMAYLSWPRQTSCRSLVGQEVLPVEKVESQARKAGCHHEVDISGLFGRPVTSDQVIWKAERLHTGQYSVLRVVYAG